MKKQTKVLLAAALFTLGASFSSMAALKNGTWQLNEEGWQYIDKEGEYVDSEWCVSYGTEYWVNEDSVLGASEWVSDYDTHVYYVQSDGSKTVNAWKYLYAEDEEDDADAEEAWFYFDSKGRMVTGKKTIGDYTYYFGNDGKMLTGWVDITDIDGNGAVEVDGDATVARNKVVYTDENGAVVKSSWVNAFTWMEDSDNLYEEDDLNWYHTNGDGIPVTGKKTYDGLTYIFDANGVMLTGWVQYIDEVYTDADAAITANTDAAYFCDEDYGYVKKDSWRYLDDPTGDDDTYWYHFDKNGKAFIATETNAIYSKEVEFTDGEIYKLTEDDAVAVNSRKINGVTYYFNTKGEMIDGLQVLDNELVYLNDGAKQTGKVTLTDENENDYEFYFADKTEDGYTKYVAVNGNKGGYLYKNGQLMTAADKDAYMWVDLDGVGSFIIDYNGKIQHSTSKTYTLEDGTEFKASENGKDFVKLDGPTEYSIKDAE